MNNKIEFYLIAFAIIISPFTLLRISFFGFAELIILSLILVTLLKGVKKKVIKNCVFSKFWLFYILVSFVGLVYNMIFLNHNTGTFEGMIFDLAAYIFVMLTCFYLESVFLTKNIEPYALFKTTFYGLSITLIILYIISLYTPTIMGYPLKKYDFFVPLVLNLHQISMVLVILPFMGLYILKNEPRKIIKFIILGLAIFSIPMALETGSTKAFLSTLFGVSIFLLFSFLLIGGKKSFPLFLAMFLMLIIMSTFSIDYVTIADKFFTENDGGGARSMIYSHGLDTALSSPIVGLGTGPQVLRGGKFWDSHQTHLTIFLQTGIVGVVAYFMLMLNVFRRLLISPALLGALTAITLYSLGGDLLRRLPIWIMLTLIYYTAISNHRKAK